MFTSLSDIKQIVQSGALRAINLYQVNENFFEVEDEGYWIIDGGVELIFTSGPVSAVFHSELESLTFMCNSVKSVYRRDNIVQLENENILKLDRYVGLRVVDLTFQKKSFEYIVDYTMKQNSQEHLVSMILTFEDHSNLQIALANYDLNENEGPSNYSYSLENDILVSTRIVEVNNE